jgi:hypothetical protein
MLHLRGLRLGQFRKGLKPDLRRTGFPIHVACLTTPFPIRKQAMRRPT